MTIGNFIIPIDVHIFFRGVAQPPTSCKLARCLAGVCRVPDVCRILCAVSVAKIGCGLGQWLGKYESGPSDRHESTKKKEVPNLGVFPDKPIDTYLGLSRYPKCRLPTIKISALSSKL